jgi:nucleotide-binding universal stress UspA family protein
MESANLATERAQGATAAYLRRACVSQARSRVPFVAWSSGAGDASLAGMNNTTPPPRFVLVVGIDASPDADRILDAACAFARGIAGSELHLVHAVEPYETEGFPVAEAYDRAVARGRSYLDEKARGAQARSGVTVIGHLRMSLATPAILQTATSTDADLVMVGTHDRKGISHWAFGSVAESVTRQAACPVLVLRPKHHATARTPEIEPPCDGCLRVQRESHGAKLWCARHAEHHPIAHLHYEMPQGFGEGSSIIRA